MKTSESIKAIAPALVKAQMSIKAAAKSATNPHFKTKYADLASIIEAVKEPLNAQGIAILQCVTSDSTGVMVETTLLHQSTEWVADTLFLPVPQQTPQAYGSAITYGRRYSLQSMIFLAAEDDDGNKASEKPEREEPRPNTAKQVAVDALLAMPPEDQDRMRIHSEEITQLYSKRENPLPYVDKLSTEEKLAVWSLLPSNVRSWYKDQQRIAGMNAAAKQMHAAELPAKHQ